MNFKGYYLALPISQVFIISCCDLMVTFLRVTKTIGWRRKVKTHVKLTNGNLEPLPYYVMLFYDPTSFPKKRFLSKEMKPSKRPTKKKIGKVKKRES